jgi:hypothetical protein
VFRQKFICGDGPMARDIIMGAGSKCRSGNSQGDVRAQRRGGDAGLFCRIQYIPYILIHFNIITSGVTQNSILLRCDTVSLRGWLQTAARIDMTSSSVANEPQKNNINVHNTCV